MMCKEERLYFSKAGSQSQYSVNLNINKSLMDIPKHSDL